MKLALAGNPNSGKTSLFNLLTGSRQHVGNWAGVTVEKKEGTLSAGGEKHVLVDLPGIYALDAETIEQRVARDFILREKPDLIINIVDATNLRRNLYFTTQLRELRRPMVIALNMMDEAEKNGTVIRKDVLGKIFGVPVVGISALKGTGVKELIGTVGEMEKNLAELPPFELPENACASCGKACGKGEERYRFIDGIIGSCVEQKNQKAAGAHSEAIDRVILNKYLAFPIFFLIMFLVFVITFGSLVSKASDGINYLLNGLLAGGLSAGLSAAGLPSPLIALICRGVIPGVGTVLSFLPQIAVLFFLMSALEDSGYMARAAIMMDRVFAGVGLSGSSFIPLIMGFGCTVPAVMACRILPTERDRRMTVMLSSFVSCSARLPLYALMVGAFFSAWRGEVIFSVYLLGIVVAVLVAFVMSRVTRHRSGASFMMELPPYRMPSLRNLLLHTWEKVQGFLVKAGTVLFTASVVLWFLQSFTPWLALTDQPGRSIIAYVGRFIAPVFAPLGFGDWRAVTALLTGVAAKEMVVSTFSVLAGGGAAGLHTAVSHIFTPLTAYAFMVFVLLYSPCISAISAMRKEFSSARWTVGTLTLDFSLAWVVSFAIVSVGRLFGL